MEHEASVHLLLRTTAIRPMFVTTNGRWWRSLACVADLLLTVLAGPHVIAFAYLSYCTE